VIQGRERKVLELLKKHQLSELASKRILEIGCGTENWIRDFMKWGALCRAVYPFTGFSIVIEA